MSPRHLITGLKMNELLQKFSFSRYGLPALLDNNRAIRARCVGEPSRADQGVPFPDQTGFASNFDDLKSFLKFHGFFSFQVNFPFLRRSLDPGDPVGHPVDFGRVRRFGCKIPILPGIALRADDFLFPGDDLGEHLRRERDGEGPHGCTAFRGLPPFCPFSRELAVLRSDFTRPIAAAADERAAS